MAGRLAWESLGLELWLGLNRWRWGGGWNYPYYGYGGLAAAPTAPFAVAAASTAPLDRQERGNWAD